MFEWNSLNAFQTNIIVRVQKLTKHFAIREKTWNNQNTHNDEGWGSDLLKRNEMQQLISYAWRRTCGDLKVFHERKPTKNEPWPWCFQYEIPDDLFYFYRFRSRPLEIQKNTLYMRNIRKCKPYLYIHTFLCGA